MSNHFSEHLVAFARTLRQAGIRTTPTQTHVFAEALNNVDVFNFEDVRLAARACLVTRFEDWKKFDDLFQKFWHELSLGGLPAALLPQTPGLPAKQNQKPSPSEQRANNNNKKTQDQTPVPLTDRSFTYSAEQVARQKRFENMNPTELESARRALEKLEWRVQERRTRRMQLTHRGPSLALRRTLRNAFKTEGEMLHLFWRDQKTKPRDIIVLADVSGSMERYARMLLQFLHAMTQQSKRGARRRLESFAFGTRISRITKHMELRDTSVALNEIGARVNDWSGGTRIGECLHTFNRTWAKRVLGRGAVVIIISDGWDQGEPQLLQQEIERLQKTCYRLIWLNPLIGTHDYKPETRALLAALPFVDDFLAVANLENLSQLAARLSSLPARKNRIANANKF